MKLSELKTDQSATIEAIKSPNEVQPNPIHTRLISLGFVIGAQVRVVAKGLFGGEPILVQVGTSRFALRCSEADLIHVNLAKEEHSR